jgi:hypothetical protein
MPSFNPRIVKALPLVLVYAISALSASSCTWQQAYNTGQAWQHNQCYKIMDEGERERCLKSTNTSYEDYKRQTEQDRKQ